MVCRGGFLWEPTGGENNATFEKIHRAKAYVNGVGVHEMNGGVIHVLKGRTPYL